MPAPLISVLIPCRNAVSTLEAAIGSVLEQSIADFDVLVWDDGSTDATPGMLARYATSDGRVRIVGDERVGLVEALRRLGQEAGGEFIARMDADDISAPTRFERQVSFLRANADLALCGCRFETIGDAIGSGRRRYDDWINAVVTPEAIRRELFVECPLPHPTFMVRAAAYRQIGGYQDHGWAEDYDLTMRFVAGGHGVGKVDEALFQWRDSAHRTSLSDPRYADVRFRALKRFYLPQIHRIRADSLYQWGAGEVGKRWLREWTDLRPQAVVDIHPRKIGTRIHGYRIIAPEELPPPGTAFTVVLVGAPGAREDIREWFTPRGYQEGSDYIFMA